MPPASYKPPTGALGQDLVPQKWHRLPLSLPSNQQKHTETPKSRPHFGRASETFRNLSFESFDCKGAVLSMLVDIGGSGKPGSLLISPPSEVLQVRVISLLVGIMGSSQLHGIAFKVELWNEDPRHISQNG